MKELINTFFLIILSTSFLSEVASEIGDSILKPIPHIHLTSTFECIFYLVNCVRGEVLDPNFESLNFYLKFLLSKPRRVGSYKDSDGTIFLSLFFFSTQ